MSKQRLPRPGERVKVGRRLLVVPGVKSMSDRDPVVPAPTPAGGESEKPADEPSEELTRTIKAAYQ